MTGLRSTCSTSQPMRESPCTLWKRQHSVKLITGQSKAAVKQSMLIESSDILEIYLAAGRDGNGIKRLCTAAGQA